MNDKTDRTDQMNPCREIIRENITYHAIFQYLPLDRREYADELAELMADVMMLPDDSTLRIAGCCSTG